MTRDGFAIPAPKTPKTSTSVAPPILLKNEEQEDDKEDDLNLWEKTDL
jgi:hypothetical protein